jgi:hypothetical protein
VAAIAAGGLAAAAWCIPAAVSSAAAATSAGRASAPGVTPTTEHAAVVDSLNALGVPDLFVGSSCECWNEPLQHPETAQVVTRQPVTLADLTAGRLLPQVQAAGTAGAGVLVLDTLAPAATAEVLLDAASLGYHPQVLDSFRLSADPVTVGNLIERFSGGAAGPALQNGLVTPAPLLTSVHFCLKGKHV